MPSPSPSREGICEPRHGWRVPSTLSGHSLRHSGIMLLFWLTDKEMAVDVCFA
jgi:hypothetical protein